MDAREGGEIATRDHPVLIPTPEGPVGGIVSEPMGEPRGRMILFPGYGRPARSGTNAFWTRVARSLAELGLVVLRTDYSREGETLPLGEGGSGLAWRRDLDMALFERILPWFSERAGASPVFLAGSCAGTRFAIELAGREPEGVGGVFLIAPDLRTFVDEGNEGVPRGDSVDHGVVERIRAILAHAPVWVLSGEGDIADLPLLERRLGQARRPLEYEVVAGTAFHFLDQPEIQQLTMDRLLSRVAAAS